MVPVQGFPIVNVKIVQTVWMFVISRFIRNFKLFIFKLKIIIMKKICRIILACCMVIISAGFINAKTVQNKIKFISRNNKEQFITQASCRARCFAINRSKDGKLCALVLSD